MGGADEGRERRGHPGGGPHLVLLGLMGAGKSTVGMMLARHLGWPYRDSDQDIEALTGRTGAQLAADPAEGVDGLHVLEEAVLLGVLAGPEPTVVAAAGWIVESARARAALARRATVVWLDAPVEVLRRRMASSAHRRPMSFDVLEQTAERRRPLFATTADRRVDATLPAEALVAEVLADTV